jgi:hypothetical protein
MSHIFSEEESDSKKEIHHLKLPKWFSHMIMSECTNRMSEGEGYLYLMMNNVID